MFLRHSPTGKAKRVCESGFSGCVTDFPENSSVYCPSFEFTSEMVTTTVAQPGTVDGSFRNRELQKNERGISLNYSIIFKSSLFPRFGRASWMALN